MEAPVEAYVNGRVEEQVAPQTLQELQAAVQEAAAVHTMPVVVGAFQEALAAEHVQAAGTPGEPGMTGSDDTPGLHLGGLSGRASGRISTSSFKNRTGPLFCQVDGCGMPLEGLKEYHQRYKVCEDHLKTPYIVRDGQQVRFCQQCGRFQPLEDFDDQKRSCRVRLQRHNARRRKKPREGGDVSDHYGVGAAAAGMAATSAAAAEMAKLAGAYGTAGAGAGALPISNKDIQAMQDALHFASTTLMHHSQVVTGKPAGEEGEDGVDAVAAAVAAGMGPNSMPFVPTPEVMMLLLKGYAAMFHYVLQDASIRPLAPPSDLPENQAVSGSLGLGTIDAIQMQQLMQAQGFLAAGGPSLPLLLSGGEAAAAGLLADGQEQQLAVAAAAAAAAAAAEEQQAAQAAAGREGQEQQAGAAAAAQHDQQAAAAAVAAAAGHEAEAQQQQEQELAAVAAAAAAAAAAGTGGLTAEQVAAAMIHPMPADAAAAEGAVAAAAALAAAAGGHLAGVPVAYQMDAATLAAATLAGQAQHVAAAASGAPAGDPAAAQPAMGQQEEHGAQPMAVEAAAGDDGMQAAAGQQ